MKVLLACPNDTPKVASFSEKGGISVPLSLAYLGSYIRDIPGVEVVGFDNNASKLSEDEYRNIFKNEVPDIIAISVLTATIYKAWEMARIAKQINPEVITIVGGVHCTALPENTLEEKAIDYGIIGEGEEPFRELVQSIKDKKDLKSIANLVYRDGDRVIINPRRPQISDIDKIPFPSRDLFDESKYGLNVNRQTTKLKNTTMITSRGCPYGCNFCSKSIYGRSFNQRAPENVISEMEFLEKNNYGELLIVDDTFTVKKKWVLEFCRQYKEKGLNIQWNCHARVNNIDEEVVRAMKEANCTGMAFGIESGNPEILEQMDKCITLEQARNAVNLCKKYKINSLCSYIFGHPGDTRKTVNDTIDVSLELDSDYANFCVLVPMPGSKIFTELLSQGVINDTNWELYVGHARETLDYSLSELSPDELQKVQRKAFRKYYFRLKYIWRRFKGINSPGDLFNLIKGVYLIILFNVQTLLSRKKN